jgi:hypothetical protein
MHLRNVKNISMFNNIYLSFFDNIILIRGMSIILTFLPDICPAFHFSKDLADNFLLSSVPRIA